MLHLYFVFYRMAPELIRGQEYDFKVILINYDQSLSLFDLDMKFYIISNDL